MKRLFLLDRGVPEGTSLNPLLNSHFLDLAKVLKVGVAVYRHQEVQFGAAGELPAFPAALEAVLHRALGDMAEFGAGTRLASLAPHLDQDPEKLIGILILIRFHKGDHLGDFFESL